MAQAVILAALLAACLWIAWNVPYTHDDWDWGLPVGLSRWLSGELNNRYLGTALVLAMTRSQWAKTLIMGLCIFFIPILAALLGAGERRDSRFPLTLLTSLALMVMPMVTWRQTYGWVSAFANFVAGAAVLLLALLLRRSCGGQRPPLWKLAGLFLMCLAAQLFAENMTVFLLAAAVCGAVYALWSGRGRATAFAALAGAALGAFFMFHNPMYGQLAVTGEAVQGIRHLTFAPGTGPAEIAAGAVERCFTVLLPGVFEGNAGTMALVGAGCIWQLAKRKASPAVILPVGLWTAFYCAWCVYVMEMSRRYYLWQSPHRWLHTGMAAVELLVILAVLLTDSGADRPRRLLLLTGAAMMMAPFAVVDEMGPRCCYLSQVLMVVLGADLLREVPWRRALTGAAALMLAAAAAFHVRAYSVIGACEHTRQQLREQATAQNAPSLSLPTETWRYGYSWGRDPQSAGRAEYYRQFYGLPEDIELIFLTRGSWEQWPQITETMMAGALVYPPEK